MNREAIKAAAAKMETTGDLLNLLNKIKMDELKDRGYPFTMPQLNYFINPKRNKDSYRSFRIPKKSGGYRTISAPVRMLKSFQHCAGILLQAFYDAPECVTGFVTAKSVVDNAEKHVGMRYVFNADLKDFFPSISKSRVWATLKTKPFSFSDRIADAIAGLCCTVVDEDEDGKPVVALPQGAPSSPVITNIVCHNLDWKLAGLARRFKVRYSRYADDITFSSDYSVFSNESEFMTEFRRIVASQRFTLNEKKTRLQKRGARQEVTGLVVSDRVNVPREYIRDLDNLLYIWERHGREAAFAKFISRYTPKQNLNVRIPAMESAVLGKLMFLKMVKGDDSSVWRRLQKRFNNVTDRKGSAAGTDIIYLYSFTIDSFEVAAGTELHWRSDEDGGPLSPWFELNGRRHSVRLSRYARTRLEHVLESGDGSFLAKFKNSFHIGLCRRAGDPEGSDFWMIFRRLPRRKTTFDTPAAPAVTETLAPAPSAMPEGVLSRPVKAEEGEFGLESFDFDGFGGGGSSDDFDFSPAEDIATSSAPVKAPAGLSTEETLAALVAAHFDLNILDQWDKTRNS